MDDLTRLLAFCRARHPAVHIVTPEEPEALALVTDAARQLGAHLWRWDAVDGLTTPLDPAAPPIENTTHPAGAMEWLVINDLSSLILLTDLADHLSDPRTLRTLRRLLGHAARNGSCVVLLDHSPALPDAVAAWATPMELGYPDDDEIDRLVRSTLRDLHQQHDIAVEISQNDYGLVLKNLRGLNRRQCAQIVRDVVASDRRFDADDLNSVLAAKRRMLAGRGVLEYVESPASLDQIGGMTRLKAWLAERERAFSTKAAEFGISPPRGILLLGVQGAGKSLCAKAIATAWKRPLLRLDPGALYDRYIGESERRLRDALAQAEAMAPVVLWIDEIEKGFASAGEASNDGGLSRRMFGSLLTWMQEHQSPVFLVATANDVASLPPELLRKGRFDEIFFIDLPGPEAREAILRTHLARRKQEPERFDLPALVAAAQGYSGAEIEQAILSALHTAFNTGQKLKTDHIADSLAGSPPLSVIMAERLAALRAWASTRCVPAE
ncbi:MAG: AAA family ATPase [Phycisphaerales bacterium]|nr:AAA family ATPase [Phycisphaerales bacterium]